MRRSVYLYLRFYERGSWAYRCDNNGHWWGIHHAEDVWSNWGPQ